MKAKATQPNSNDDSSGIIAAARWLVDHRETVHGAIIPLLRSKFDLTPLDAIKAAQLAHRLQYDDRSA
jgi:hypothetical protein